MQIRQASIEDAEAACLIVRRSIAELCRIDHQGDEPTLALWLANKTADNMRRWIGQHHVLVAAEADGAILGVAAMNDAGEIMLNYVSPDARFRGISKALLRQLEARAGQHSIARLTLLSTATARAFYLAAGYRQTGDPVTGFGKTIGYPMAKALQSPAHANPFGNSGT